MRFVRQASTCGPEPPGGNLTQREAPEPPPGPTKGHRVRSGTSSKTAAGSAARGAESRRSARRPGRRGRVYIPPARCPVSRLRLGVALLTRRLVSISVSTIDNPANTPVLAVTALNSATRRQGTFAHAPPRSPPRSQSRPVRVSWPRLAATRCRPILRLDMFAEQSVMVAIRMRRRRAICGRLSGAVRFTFAGDGDQEDA